MNILFINPPRFNELVGKNPSVIEHNRGYSPPLGILALATTVQADTGNQHNVEVLDCQPTKMSYSSLTTYLGGNKYDLIGLTAMTFTLIDVVKTCEIIKQQQPDCRILLGGPHVHLYPDDTMTLPGVDYLVQGEGELAILELLQALDGKRRLEDVSGLVFRNENGKITNNGIAPKIRDLDAIRYPDRTLLPVSHYNSLLAKTDLSTTMFTSRGCPFRCTFCDRPMSPTMSGFRWRSAINVVQEMAECQRLGIVEISIYDDTFSIRKDRVYEICEEILSQGIGIAWDVRAHVNTVDLPLLKAMKRAGCSRIHYGVESGNDRMLKLIRKNTTVNKIKETFLNTRTVGMESLAYLMIGQQSETHEDVVDSMRLVNEIKPDYCHFTIFCPYPGTEIYQIGLDEGIIKEDVWRRFARNPVPGFQLPVWEENFTRNELYDLVVKCYKSFYTKPEYIIKSIARIRSFNELRRHARAGLSVFRMKADEVAKLDLSKAQVMK